MSTPNEYEPMHEDDRATLERLLTEYGTDGVAQELASICRDRAKDEDGSPRMEGWWKHEAERFARNA